MQAGTHCCVYCILLYIVATGDCIDYHQCHHYSLNVNVCLYIATIYSYALGARSTDEHRVLAQLVLLATR